ncbi:MAG: Na+/H+ antiporter NhaA [Solirubrobacterales bacterium]
MLRRIKDPDTSWRDAGSDFIKSEISGGFVLLAAAVLALIWANAPFGSTYESFWQTDLTIGFGQFAITEDLQHWVNDALMVLFFFVVGLEIKRELVVGELNDRTKAALPLFAAVGGVVVPALIYASLNFGGLGAPGWAIPMATDIAFAIAVLALLGKRIPSGVRLLLLSIAIIDDVIAILVIAVFYSTDISTLWLAVGAVGLLVVYLMQRFGVDRIWPYWVIGVAIWVAFLSSGVHATIAGVILGLMTPAHPIKGRHVIEDLEHRIHPWTSMLIVPLFALANAGIIISATILTEATASMIFWGVAIGLIVGKIIGIGSGIAIAQRLGWGSVPDGVSRSHIWGVAALGGIGFTVSLFIAELSFESELLLEYSKIGIFTGSIISALIGVFLLTRHIRVEKRAVEAPDR